VGPVPSGMCRGTKPIDGLDQCVFQSTRLLPTTQQAQGSKPADCKLEIL
jgi:hypothetical protein